MALVVNAVVISAGSENHTPGRSLRHCELSTPPSTIGISTLSPERLSVMVMESATPHFYNRRGPSSACAPGRGREPLPNRRGRASAHPGTGGHLDAQEILRP